MGEDGQHARLLQGHTSVNVLDAALGDVAGFEHAVGEAGQDVFGRIFGSAHYLVAAIHAVQRFADYARFGRCLKKGRFVFHGFSGYVERSRDAIFYVSSLLMLFS